MDVAVVRWRDHYSKCALIIDHYPVATDIDLLGFRIFGNDKATRPNVATAIQLVPTWTRKAPQIDLLILEHIFQNRSGIHPPGLNRLDLLEAMRPRANKIQISNVRRHIASE